MLVSPHLLKFAIYFVGSGGQLSRVFDLSPLCYLEHYPGERAGDLGVPMAALGCKKVDKVTSLVVSVSVLSILQLSFSGGGVPLVLPRSSGFTTLTKDPTQL